VIIAQQKSPSFGWEIAPLLARLWFFCRWVFHGSSFDWIEWDQVKWNACHVVSDAWSRFHGLASRKSGRQRWAGSLRHWLLFNHELPVTIPPRHLFGISVDYFSFFLYTKIHELSLNSHLQLDIPFFDIKRNRNKWTAQDYYTGMHLTKVIQICMNLNMNTFRAFNWSIQQIQDGLAITKRCGLGCLDRSFPGSDQHRRFQAWTPSKHALKPNDMFIWCHVFILIHEDELIWCHVLIHFIPSGWAFYLAPLCVALK